MATPSMTVEQKQEAVDALQKYGSQQAAADALGLSRTTYQSRLYAGIKAGLDQAIVHPAPQGHTVKGVSTLYDAGGNVAMQWVKTRSDGPDPEELAEKLRGIFEGMTPAAQLREIGRLEAKLEQAKPASEPTKPLVKTTKAPTPIKPLGGGKAPGTGATDWMDSEDYETFRKGRKQAAGE